MDNYIYDCVCDYDCVASCLRGETEAVIPCGINDFQE